LTQNLLLAQSLQSIIGATDTLRSSGIARSRAEVLMLLVFSMARTLPNSWTSAVHAAYFVSARAWW